MTGIILLSIVLETPRILVLKKIYDNGEMAIKTYDKRTRTLIALKTHDLYSELIRTQPIENIPGYNEQSKYWLPKFDLEEDN